MEKNYDVSSDDILPKKQDMPVRPVEFIDSKTGAR